MKIPFLNNMIRPLFVRGGWAAALILLGAGTVPAQESTEYTGLYTLEEVVVSAAQDGPTAGGTLRTVTEQDMELMGARTVDQALEMVPGLNIRIGGRGVPRINLRGFRSRHVLLLLDGIPINSTFDGMFDPSILPVENIQDIRVTTGGSSVLYGQGALGGVINIITRRGTPGVRGRAKQEFGEHVKYDSRCSISGARDQLDFFLSGSLYKTDGYELSRDFEATSEEDGGLRENSARTRKSGFVKLGFTPDDRLNLGLTFSYVEGETGSPPNTIDDRQDPFARRVRYDRVDDFAQYSVQVSAGYDAPGPWEIKSWLYYNENDQERNRYDDDGYDSMDDIYIKKTFHQRTETSVVGGNLHVRRDFGRAGALTLGLGAQHDRWKETGRIRDKMVAVGGVTEADMAGGGGTGTGGGGGGGSSPGGKKKKYYYMRHYRHNRDIDMYSAALEYEFSPLERLTCLLGYAHYWQRLEGGDDDGDYSFVAGASYEVTDGTSLSGSVSRKVRFPAIRQLYDETRGNPLLEPERSYNYELGLAQQLPWDGRLTISAFCNDVEDYIQKDDFTERFENRDRYRFRGVETTLELRPLAGLTFRLGYTYLDTDDQSSDTDKDQIQYNPRDKLTLEAVYRAPFGLTAYVSMKHINREYFYSRREPVQKRKLNEYTLVNLKLSQRLVNDRVTAYLGADNLFDKDYQTAYGLPQAGRFVYGGVKLEF